MELIKCETCGASSFTDNKCDYCRNQYEATDDDQTKEICDDETEDYIQDFQETPEGKILLKIMVWILVSIIWFAICIFVPPLFLITICGLIILPVIKKLKK